jgi:hypothetical protein
VTHLYDFLEMVVIAGLLVFTLIWLIGLIIEIFRD